MDSTTRRKKKTAPPKRRKQRNTAPPEAAPPRQEEAGKQHHPKGGGGKTAPTRGRRKQATPKKKGGWRNQHHTRIESSATQNHPKQHRPQGGEEGKTAPPKRRFFSDSLYITLIQFHLVWIGYIWLQIGYIWLHSFFYCHTKLQRGKGSTIPKEEEEGSTNAAPPTRRMANPTLLKFSVLYCNCVLNREAEEGSATLNEEEEKAAHPLGRGRKSTTHKGEEESNQYPKERGWREYHHPEGRRRRQHHPRGLHMNIWWVCAAHLGSRIISSLCRDASSVFTHVFVCWVIQCLSCFGCDSSCCHRVGLCLCLVCVHVLCAFLR